MNNKGQALVEFIIILPVLMLIVLGMVDFGNIIYKKYSLEEDLDVLVSLYQDDKTDEMNDYALKNNLGLNFLYEDGNTTIVVSEKFKINTPLLNKVLNSPYKIETKRVIYHES